MANDARVTIRPRLARLDELDDYKVADGDPDIRGWKATGNDGRAFGSVHDLIVDLSAMKVRYMDVEVDREAAGIEADHHVLIPIGCARLDDTGDRVIVDTLTARDVARIPGYAHGPIDRQTELAVRDCHNLASATMPAADADIYEGSHFDDQRFFGNRRRGREKEAYLAGPVVTAEGDEVRRPITTESRETGTGATSDRDRDRFRGEPRAP